MNPKTKAVELVLKFSETTIQYDQAIKCALIAVDEILEALEEHQWQNRHVTEYYTEVKKKIRKL